MPALVVQSRPVPAPDGTILVDDCSGHGAALNIDHHVGNATPACYAIGTTATERVITALGQGLDPNDYRSVMIRHYDADGVLAAWTLLNPELALQHSGMLIFMAQLGDFLEGHWDTVEGEAALNGAIELQDALFARTRRRIRDWLSADVLTRRLHRQGMQLIPGILAGDPPSTEAAAIADRCHRTRDVLTVQVTTKMGALLQVSRDVPLYAVLAASCRPILVLHEPDSHGEHHYSLILRPRFGWGYSDDAVGRPAVRDLALLWKLLRDAERRCANKTRWRAHRYDGSIWRLDTLGGSRLAAEKMLELVNMGVP